MPSLENINNGESVSPCFSGAGGAGRKCCFHGAGPLLVLLASAHSMSGRTLCAQNTVIVTIKRAPDIPKQPLAEKHQIRQESPVWLCPKWVHPQKPSALELAWPALGHWRTPAISSCALP